MDGFKFQAEKLRAVREQNMRQWQRRIRAIVIAVLLIPALLYFNYTRNHTEEQKKEQEHTTDSMKPTITLPPQGR